MRLQLIALFIAAMVAIAGHSSVGSAQEFEAVAQADTAIAVREGWWMAVPGSGVAISAKPGKLFIGYFTYASTGAPIWAISTLTAMAGLPNVYFGVLQSCRQPGGTLMCEESNTVTLTVSSPTSVVMRLTPGSGPITLTVFDQF